MYNKEISEKLYAYFKLRHDMEDYHKGWLRGDCPDCGKNKKWGVQIFHNRTNCFVCGYNEKPIHAILKIEGKTELKEAWQIVKAFDKVNYEMPDVEKFERDSNKNRKIQTLTLPEGFKNILLGSNEVSKSARNYLRSRGFSINRLAYQGIGYCEGDNDYFGYIIFPFTVAGKLKYFQARKFIGSGPKFNNPEVEIFGIGKTQLIYNVDCIWIYKKIWLVESITNALTIGPNAIAIMGKSISPYQLSLIIKSSVEEIVICLDNDAILLQIKLALKLIPYKKIKLVLMPDERDVNNWGKKEIKKMEKSEELITYNNLLKLKHEYEA